MTYSPYTLSDLQPAIGDFDYKLPSSFAKYLFSKVPSTEGKDSKHAVVHNNHTPPSVLGKPEVRHIDLVPLRPKKPTLVLYTDGVDNIIHGRFLFRSLKPYTDPPAAVIGALLGDTVDQGFMRNVFDHEVELRWNGPHGNRAVELLGNILGGKDASRFSQALDPKRLAVGDDDEEDLYIDDTSIIVCPLT